MDIRIGVIEWGSESLREPSVFIGEHLAILHWAARAMQNYVFDDGGEIDQHRDTYREDMTPEELNEWHEAMWDYSTEAWVGIYTMNNGLTGEAEFLTSGGHLE